MHGLPASEEEAGEHTRGHAMSLSITDFISPLVLYIAKFGFP